MFRGITLLTGLFLLVSALPVGAVTLKIATIAPEGTTWMNEMRAGAEEIAGRTDGRVKFKFYPGGVMGNDKSVMRKMRIGQLHGGALTSGELSGVYPDIQLYSIPLQFRSYDEVDYVRQRMDDLLKTGLENAGFVPLGLSEGGFVYIMCKKPLRQLDDLKGQKVWMPEGDTLAEAVFKVLGVSPVSLPISDVYTGLQTGLVDTVGSPPMATIAFQWHTKLTHLTDVPLLYLVGVLVVDKKAFNKISAGDQATVRQVMGEVFDRLEKSNRRDNEEARGALRRQGMEFVEPNATELAAWYRIAEKSVEHLRADHAFSETLFDALQEHLKAYRKQSPSQ